MDKGILVLNAGSSSLKFAVYRVADALQVIVRGQVAGIGTQPVLAVRHADQGDDKQPLSGVDSHRDAIAVALDEVERLSGGRRLAGVGHRVVHGGGERNAPALVDAALLDELDALAPLAPHHQPHNLAAIRAVAATAPDLPQVACFDTAFHTTQPAVARLLPLPARYRDKGLQRYGFHGLSYEYVSTAVAQHNGGRMPQRMVIAHLGNGASLCALRDGRSVATSMGFSTLDGLLMGTRCGSIDPGVLLHLMREEQMDEPELSDLLYNNSGLFGVSGVSGDMRSLLASDRPAAHAAVDLFCYTLVRAIGSMTAALGGLDALVFTGGIGEHAAAVRRRVCADLGWLGVEIDGDANEAGEVTISRPGTAVSAWVVPTDEELVIARHTLRLLSGQPRAGIAGC